MNWQLPETEREKVPKVHFFKPPWAQNQEAPSSWEPEVGLMPVATRGTAGGPPRAAVRKALSVSRAGALGEATGVGQDTLGGQEGGGGLQKT